MMLTLPRLTDDALVESTLRQAWDRCVKERQLLQVKLVVKPGDMSPLGQRYGLAATDDAATDARTSSLFAIQKVTQLPDLLRHLQQVGTTALDPQKGSYYVQCLLLVEEDDKQQQTTRTVQVVLSLCHALSDGPGALRVARSFLMHLSDVLNGVVEREPKDPQPLVDLQKLLLGDDYSKDDNEPKSSSLFVGHDEYLKALLGTQAPGGLATIGNFSILPPEAMQKIPSDEGFGGPSFIECTHFHLSAEKTCLLRTKCRQHGASVQGALVAAALKARWTLLLGKEQHNNRDLRPPPVLAAVQIPVNMRSFANIDEDLCLCGSAGVWHTTKITTSEALFADWWEIAKQSTQFVRTALQEENAQQPKEWLKRLLHAPSTLPPYSLMVSSVGVAPIEASYGDKVHVEKLYFFGGAIRTKTPSQAVGSMVHAVTFKDECHCVVNFTSPGISKAFADDNAKEIKATLLAFADGI
jgi:hypothetical protein